MLEHFSELRLAPDGIMLRCMHSRIAMLGNGYSGRFIRWYAKYYHGIEIDYVISDIRLMGSFEPEIFQPSIFSAYYKDFDTCILWLAVPRTEQISALLEHYHYRVNENFFDFFEAVYGEDVVWSDNEAGVTPFTKHKTGTRDIQFPEWLEWKYGCNFVTAVELFDFRNDISDSHAYRVIAEKELFTILDQLHMHPGKLDAFFDVGCGKGAAMVSALDYGFHRVGGIEYEDGIYDVCVDNFEKLGLSDRAFLYKGNAAKLGEEIDAFNVFFLNSPFGNEIAIPCMQAIEASFRRHPRRLRIVMYAPTVGRYIEENSIFTLLSQFTIHSRQRIVQIYGCEGR